MKHTKVIVVSCVTVALALILAFMLLRSGSPENDAAEPNLAAAPKPASTLAQARTSEEPDETLTPEEREQHQQRRTEIMEKFSQMSEEERKQFIASQAVPAKRPTNPRQQARRELQKKLQAMTEAEKRRFIEEIIQQRQALTRARELQRDVNEPLDANQVDGQSP